MNVLLKAFTLYSTEKENIWDRASRKNDSSQILLAAARDGGIFLYEEYKKKDLGDAREHCRMLLQQMQEKGSKLEGCRLASMIYRMGADFEVR